MNRDSNTYTILYASIMVIIVAVALAFTSQSLKGRQKANENIDKMLQVLRSVNIEATNKNAVEIWNTTITDAFLVNRDGQIDEKSHGKDANSPAFTLDEIASFKKVDGQNNGPFPIYVASVKGETKYILAMRGAGLWGPIWGYISVNEDLNTVFGANFSHQGETPGLGAEIAKPSFSNEFIGKHLFSNDTFTSIAVVKPGHNAEGQDYVDGISGGTLTSKGVHNMLWDSMDCYKNFLISNKN